MFEIRFLNDRVRKEFEQLPAVVAARFRAQLGALRRNPLQSFVVKLHGGGYRIRHGDYRATFEVDKKQKLIVLIKAGHRREIYKRARHRRRKR